MAARGELTAAQRGITPDNTAVTPRIEGIRSHELPFENKVILVTGANRPTGIGAATARKFARGGAAVVIITGREQSRESAQTVLSELQELGTHPEWIEGDIADPQTPEKIIAEARGVYHHIDVIVNNAGIIRDNKLIYMTLGEWNEVIDTNLRPAFLIVQELMKQEAYDKDKGGAVVNVSSIVGLYGNPDQDNYAAAKAGLVGLVKAQAKELGPHGIRVNGVAPGFIETDMTQRFVRKEVVRTAMEKLTPLRRLGTPEDVADVITFLASQDARYVTGQVIEVDGGLNGAISALPVVARKNMEIAVLKRKK